ncbi:hypothetical protein ACIBF6_14310 [Streptosporangium amethystogenes]|uniref:hypothetical protein n=1 Tax=Streptosporangium amethystogenes TaxID=2002 RepID=UPI00379A9D61
MRATTKVFLWWIALLMGWLATVPVVTIAELLAATGCGLVCAVVAVLVGRLAGLSWRLEPGWGAWLGPLAVAVVADTVRLPVRVVPHMLRDRDWDGRLLRLNPAQAGPETKEPAVTSDTGPDTETPARAAARRAVGTIALSAAPCGLVLDWPADGRPVLLHMLAGDEPSLGRRVIR